jgi:hypothetical protein
LNHIIYAFMDRLWSSYGNTILSNSNDGYIVMTYKFIFDRCHHEYEMCQAVREPSTTSRYWRLLIDTISICRQMCWHDFWTNNCQWKKCNELLLSLLVLLLFPFCFSILFYKSDYIHVTSIAISANIDTEFSSSNKQFWDKQTQNRMMIRNIILL